jgi:FK506-binding nuclear protein
MLPVALYGLEIPPGDILIPAVADFPATVSSSSPSHLGAKLLGDLKYRPQCPNTANIYHLKFRITMAAIDPSAPAEFDDANGSSIARSTLKLIRQPIDPEDDDEDSDDEEYMRALLGEDDSEDDSEEEEEANGGPSDPAKSKKARKAAAVAELLASLEKSDDEDMEDAPNGTNGTKSKKGKAPASGDEEEGSEEDSEDDDEEDLELEEFVICTLDPEKVQLPIFFNFFL